MQLRHRLILLITFILPMLLVFAETDTVVILHTNDLHGHVRAGYEGVGGMPYVSGYIKKVRAERPDTLVLDAGDVMDKGDMLAFATENRIMYEAMGKIGYAAATLGNHDLDHSVPLLRECEGLASGMALLCLNFRKEDGTPQFAASKVFNVDGVKVGVIGVTVPKGGVFMDMDECAKALTDEAERLEPEAHLLVALCHLGSSDCKDLSKRVPAVDVFVSGHTHELLPKPVRVEETGALIVQAGDYARHVGRLELTVDLDSEKVVRAAGAVVDMDQSEVPCDKPMLDWVRAREQELCPDAARVCAHTTNGMGMVDAGRLAAAALKDYAKADLGFCQPRQIIRSSLPKGDVDVNALFLTGGQRGCTVVFFDASGRDIETYLASLKDSRKSDAIWAGFRASVSYDAAENKWTARSNLDPARTYKVIMPQLEWDTRFRRVVKSAEANAKPDECPFTFTDALKPYVDALTQKGVSLEQQVKTLAREAALR